MEISAAALWLNTAFAAFDQNITLLVHQLYTFAGGFFTPFFEFVSLLGKGGIFLVLLSLTLMLYRPTRRFGTAMLFGVAIGALFTNVFLKVVIARPRPYADESSIFHQLWLLVGQNVESDKSFPSGHTTAAFSTMTALFLMGNKKYSWTAFIFAFLMGLARIYLVVHFHSDVMGCIIFVRVAGCLGALIASKLPEGWYGSCLKKKKAGEEQCLDSEN